MEQSLLYDLLLPKIYEYRKTLEKVEDNFSKWVKESRENLEKSFNKEQIQLVDKHNYNVGLREDYISSQLAIKILNFGIKLGMQLQQSFSEEEE